MTADALDALTAPFLASDLAGEVRSVYLEHTAVGVDAGPATAAVFASFEALMSDANEGPVVLLALAALQLRSGELLDPIRDAALALIENGDAARAWRPPDGMAVARRRAALAELSALLAR